MCKECNDGKIKEKKIRKVFLDELPRWEKGLHKNKINWKQSIGLKITGIYNDLNFEVEIINCDSKYLYIKYLDKPIFKIQIKDFRNGHLGKLLGLRTNEYKIEIGQKFKDNKRDLIIINRKIIKDSKGHIWKVYKYKCNRCGFECGENYKNGKYYREHWIKEGHLLYGYGCACCCNSSKITVPKINDIVTTAPELIKYFQNPDETKLYTKSSGQKIKVKCPDCGRIKEKPMAISTIYKYKSIGCSCGDGISYPEKIMYQVLKELNIEFQYQYRPKWCTYELNNKKKFGIYDFYFELDGKKYIIEMDGDFHNKNNRMNGRTKEETKYIDDIKDRLADKYGIKVIRIDCKESDLNYIKDKILKSELNKMFDLSNINWLKCEEFALNNLIKQACKYKRNNPDLTTVQIGKIMNMCKITIQRYLKKGNLLGWCEYDPNLERIKGKKKGANVIGKKNSKKIEMYKNNILIRNFESATQLSKISEDLFGIKLIQSCIARVCRGELSQHKGFTFKYIEERNDCLD